MNKLTPEEEQQLLLECIKHDRCAGLVRQYFNLVYYTVRKIYIAKKIRFTTEDIEDRQQDVFEKLFENNKKKLRQYNRKHGLRLEGWIRLIAARTILSHLRKKKELLDDEDFRIPIEDFDNEFGGKSEDRRLDARQKLLKTVEAVENLSPPYDLVLKLDWFHWRSPEEISEILGRPVDDIYVLKSRAVKQLKKILKE
ncbi:MAG: sigma-70 family RNA polymerase sigma factor [Desulfobacteraceae bacterium]|nr:sigma-70 family RNA polymerase sigma factor [Desulfobacteraceae bacterium]